MPAESDRRLTTTAVCHYGEVWWLCGSLSKRHNLRSPGFQRIVVSISMSQRQHASEATLFSTLAVQVFF